MRRTPDFAELLDAAIAADERAAMPGGGLSFAPETPYPFVYYRALRSLGTDVATVRRHAARAASHRPAPPRPAASRPSSSRPLTAAECAALRTLNAFGADLTPDFTVNELRRAFKRAARRCHPDAHHDAGPLECTRLGQVFGAVSEAYRLLLGVKG